MLSKASHNTTLARIQPSFTTGREERILPVIKRIIIYYSDNITFENLFYILIFLKRYYCFNVKKKNVTTSSKYLLLLSLLHHFYYININEIIENLIVKTLFFTLCSHAFICYYRPEYKYVNAEETPCSGVK